MFEHIFNIDYKIPQKIYEVFIELWNSNQIPAHEKLVNF